MSTTMKVALTFIGAWGLWVLLATFVAWGFNPSEWDALSRALFLLFGLLFAVLCSGLAYECFWKYK